MGQANDDLRRALASLGDDEAVDARVQPLLDAVESLLERRDRERERLTRSLDLARETVDFAPVGIYRSTPDGAIVFANTELVRMLGYEHESELLALSMNDVYADHHERQRLIDRHEPVGSASGIEVRWRAKNGEVVWVLMKARAIKDEGTTRLFEGFVIDITTRRALERQLFQAQKLDAIGRLAGGVAHDFNNLLQAMMATLGFLEAVIEDRDLADSVQVLVAQVDRGAALTRQLLQFSRQSDDTVAPLDLNDCVRENLRLVRSVIRENIEVEVSLGRDDLVVEAEPAKLGQVMLNLVVNACDAMADGGHLHLRCGEGGPDEVFFQVEDTGCGIAEADRTRVFEPFFTTKGIDQGAGLGLAVAHGIVSGLGGRIEVESTVGRGSTFRVVLPRQRASAPSSPRASVGATPRGHGERILLVEDEPSTREAVAAALERLGYRVTAAASAEEVEAARLQPFDLLVTDLILPGKGGAELARQLVARWPGLRVVIMSGYSPEDGLGSALANGAHRFLNKPVSIDTLAREVRSALEESLHGQGWLPEGRSTR